MGEGKNSNKGSFGIMLSQLTLVMMGLVALVLLLMTVGAVSDKYYSGEQNKKDMELDKQEAFAQGLTYEQYLALREKEKEQQQREEAGGQAGGQTAAEALEEPTPYEEVTVDEAGAAGDIPLTVSGQMLLTGPDTNVSEAEINEMEGKGAIIHTTMGDIPIEFNAKAAPVSVKNFIYLAEHRYYDGQCFYRTYPGAHIQTGSPSGRPGGTPGYWVDAEFTNLFPVKGALAFLPCLNGVKMAGEMVLFLDNAATMAEEATVFARTTQQFDVADKCADSRFDREGYLIDRTYITNIEIVDRSKIMPPNQ